MWNAYIILIYRKRRYEHNGMIWLPTDDSNQKTMN